MTSPNETLSVPECSVCKGLLARFERAGTVGFGIRTATGVRMLPNGDEWPSAALLREAAVAPAPTFALEEVTPLPFLRPDNRVFAVALNFHTHVGETLNTATESPVIFFKPNSTFVTPGEALRPPAGYTNHFDYEGELAVVIGRQCHAVPEAQALDCVLGITALMDGTARDRLRVKAGEKIFQDWLSSKGANNSSMLSPYIAVGDEVVSAMREGALEIKTVLNGKVVQQASIRQLIFSIPHLIAFLTRFTTLFPGDVISVGTPGGIGMATGNLLKSGDALTVSVSLVPPISATVA